MDSDATKRQTNVCSETVSDKRPAPAGPEWTSDFHIVQPPYIGEHPVQLV